MAKTKASSNPEKEVTPPTPPKSNENTADDAVEVSEDVVLKCDHTHCGVTFKKGASINDLEEAGKLNPSDLKFLQSRGVI